MLKCYYFLNESIEMHSHFQNHDCKEVVAGVFLCSLRFDTLTILIEQQEVFFGVGNYRWTYQNTTPEVVKLTINSNLNVQVYSLPLARFPPG